MESDPLLLEIENLKVYFFLDDVTVRAVDGVSVAIPRGTITGVVGESGCGKSVTARAILGLVRPPGRIVDGCIRYHRPGANGSSAQAVDLCQLDPYGDEIRSIRGKEISMVFQEPSASLSPVHTIGSQIAEPILLHQHVSELEAHNRAIELLRKVGMPKPEEHVNEYSFRLSGGMRQRAMIAMALACNPNLLIADEPTTALDVTTQAQILELIAELQADMNMAVLLITHNLGIIAQMAQRVVVMYLGKVVEEANVEDLFDHSRHPYTQALLESIPRLSALRRKREPLPVIEGSVPPPHLRPRGCPFHPRCARFMAGICDVEEPAPTFVDADHSVSCFLYASESAEVAG